MGLVQFTCSGVLTQTSGFGSSGDGDGDGDGYRESPDVVHGVWQQKSLGCMLAGQVAELVPDGERDPPALGLNTSARPRLECGVGQ